MEGADPQTHEALAGIAGGHPESLRQLLGSHEPLGGSTELDERTVALVRIAALIALDGPPAAFGWQISEATAAGAMPAEILEVLRATAPLVGAARATAAAPEIMLALGLKLPGPAAELEGNR